MPTLQLIITDAGRQAIVDAQNTGTLPVVLDQFALGTGKWSPDATATTLQAEIKRIDTVGGLAVAADTIHVTCTDDSADAYALGEFGLYTDGGVLFAIYSDLAGITDKAADALLLLAADVVLTSVPPGSVTVNGVGFSNPPATESAPGIAKIATLPMIDEGLDDEAIVSPKKLADASSSGSIANSWVRRDANGNFRTNVPIHDNDVARKIDIALAIASLLDSAPGALDTLNELAAALGDDPNFAATMTTALAGKQPLDATLTALAALATAADKIIYATGADTFATATLTTFARTLLGAANAAAARTTLGAQAADATLTALAGVVTAANKLIYATGSDTFATSTLTAFARTLLDDATGEAMFNTLGAQQSLTVNGYQKLPSGLIIQWGKTALLPPISDSAITFPIAFPSACIYGGANCSSNQSQYQANMVNISTTGATVNNGSGYSQVLQWVALGA